MNHYRRRDFLKFGAALPLAIRSLDSRGADAARPPAPPKRIMFICNSLGFYAPSFFPKARGDLATSEYLGGMATAEKMTVFQNLSHEGMDTSNHDSEKSFLAGAPNPEAVNFTNTISVDQILARELGSDTRFHFLPLSIYDRGWGCSWNERGVAIPPMHNEAKVFDKLFGEEDLTAKRQRIRQDQLIVGSLHRDIEQLRKQPGNAAKIDSYKNVIIELEKQLAHEEFWLTTQKPDVPNTLSDDREFAFSTKVRNLFELSKLAFQTDSTRVITLSLDWIYGAIKVPGATGGWHTLSHHGGKADALAKLARIETDILRHLNRFLAELDRIGEGDGTLLDHTTVVMGSNFGDSSNHTCDNLPMIVAGGGHRHQAHTALDRPTPLCNLYLELLHTHGIDAASFGNGRRDQSLLGA
ncbi:MAG: DUF1552 domain-containing protein [Verrucomicrobiales bacterium]